MGIMGTQMCCTDPTQPNFVQICTSAAGIPVRQRAVIVQLPYDFRMAAEFTFNKQAQPGSQDRIELSRVCLAPALRLSCYLCNRANFAAKVALSRS